MINLSPDEKRDACCENDCLSRSAGCVTHHTFEQLLELVSSYRDRVPEAAKVAGAFCVNILDIFTRSDVPDSARVLGEQQYREIIAGRRELLDAGIKLHATCLINSAYHGTERALQKAVTGEEYDAQAYMCSNPKPRERRRREEPLVPVASVFDRAGDSSDDDLNEVLQPLQIVGRGTAKVKLVELPPPVWDEAAEPPPPVDRSKTTLADGRPVTADHREIDPATGMQKGYVVLSDEERAKGFVRPVRRSYRHVGIRPRFQVRDLTDAEKERHASEGYVKYEEYPESERPFVGRFWTEQQLRSGCGSVTTMGQAIAETYARDPSFYDGTMCVQCRNHFAVGANGEFVWVEADGSDGPRVGT